MADLGLKSPSPHPQDEKQNQCSESQKPETAFAERRFSRDSGIQAPSVPGPSSAVKRDQYHPITRPLTSRPDSTVLSGDVESRQNHRGVTQARTMCVPVLSGGNPLTFTGHCTEKKAT